MSSAKSPRHRQSHQRSWLLDRLLAWYDEHRRALPWRAAAGVRPDPYHVLLSEIMLQQTTAATASQRFDPFIARFPTLHALAAAEETEVLHAWQGLGYYRRARALHACARILVNQHDGAMPREETALLALPGIGPYTANAIRAIVFDQPAVPLDGNVERVMARLHRIETPLPKARDELRRLAAQLAPSERAGDVAQALMDLGALVCRPTRPHCTTCPWASRCAAHAADVAAQLPRRVPRPERPVRRGLAFLLTRADGAILFRRRPPDGLLGGLHELPSSPWEDGPMQLDAAWRHAPTPADWRLHRAPMRHVFTHFVLELTLAEGRTDAPPEGLWCQPQHIDRLALPSVMKKLLDRVGYM